MVERSMHGRVALVTGSTRGIGWATAKRLATDGATVVIVGHSDPDLIDARVRELQGEFQSPHCVGYRVDVSDPSQIKGMFRDVFTAFKRLDILVNNAGIMKDAVIGMMAEDLIQQTFQINTIAAVHCTQAAVKLMNRNGSGSIVNLSSVVGTHGNEGQMLYSASKAALVGMTRSAAKELAPKNIRVNAVAPGFIQTDLVEHLLGDGKTNPLPRIRMNRPGKPEEVAELIHFLASDRASYITGQVIGIDGGMII